MKRILAFAICALIIVTSVVSCSETTVQDEKTPNAAEDSTVVENVEVEADITVTDIVANRYADTNLNGYEYKVLAISTDKHFYTGVQAGINEVYAEEYNGDLINDAIFSRNLKTEETLNVVITPVWGGDTGDIQSQLHKDVLAGSHDYDTVINRMDYLGTSMTNGDLLNIKNISTIDTSDSWWDKNIVDAFTLFGGQKLYWISGDINIFDDFAVEVIFFNKSICDDCGLEYPYSSVIEGTWTIEKFYQMAKQAERDVDGDGRLVISKDIVGHAESNDHIKHWIYAMGEKSLDIAEDGSLEVMNLTERQIQAVDTLYKYMVEGEMTYTGSPAIFSEGHELFQGDMLGPINTFREMEQEFGVVPMPKMNEEQEHYGEYVSNGWTTAYGFPMTNTDAETTGIVFDALCGFSTDTLRVALYDVLFAAKLVRDAESVQMLDIIFDSKSYDWAVDFSWGSSFQTAYNNVYNNKKNNYVSDAEKMQKAINKSISKIVEKIQELEY